MACPMQNFISTTPISGLSFPSELPQQMASMASGINNGRAMHEDMGEIGQSIGTSLANQHLESGQGFPIPSSWTDSLPPVARVTQAPNIPAGQPGLQFERRLDPAGEEFWKGMNGVLESMGQGEKLRSFMDFLSDPARMAWKKLCSFCQTTLDWLKSAYSFVQWTDTLSASALASMVGGYMARYMMKWTCQLVRLSESLVGDLTTWFAGQLGAMLAAVGGAAGGIMSAVGQLWRAFSGSLAGLIAYSIQSAGGIIGNFDYLKNVCIQCVGTGYKFELQAGESSLSEPGSSIGATAGGLFGGFLAVLVNPFVAIPGLLESDSFACRLYSHLDSQGRSVGGHIGGAVGDVAGRVLGARLINGPCTSCGGQGHTNF